MQHVSNIYLLSQPESAKRSAALSSLPETDGPFSNLLCCICGLQSLCLESGKTCHRPAPANTTLSTLFSENHFTNKGPLQIPTGHMSHRFHLSILSVTSYSYKQPQMTTEMDRQMGPFIVAGGGPFLAEGDLQSYRSHTEQRRGCLQT